MHYSSTPVHDTPTVDELEALKSLEMGGALSVPEALHRHLSGRLLEYGYVERDARGEPTGLFRENTFMPLVEHSLLRAAPGFTVAEKSWITGLLGE